ncbi:G-type lectin S-receptor-like serine/threonine-protein kinase [Citrus sinensis]|uniref:G-type lectin S-receptor-like serine/threonine-protein kinase n=1 Tax=Citrus sinensis TaxID=2711 RepID=A0ACB8J9V5_CITSI|nr:G-type lectin S-receptor-like serine/threonine-protein kinase [Citrus sinensis]
MVSANQRFRLGFFNPPSTTTHYLAISYVKPHELGDDETDKLVWIANRNTPIFDTSGSLTIDSNDGNLKILHNGGDPIAVSSIPGAGNNTIAILQDSGNLVLQEANHDGSTRRVLWQSFDYPTDTFLPGMKLGINLEADKKWFLQSWITEESPAQGSFTLGVDPNFTNHLSIWWRGEFHSNIGLWRNGIFDSSGDSTISDFIFSYTSNKQEKYFTYSVKGNVTLFPRLRIMADGILATHNGKERLIEGYPVCRNASSDFKTITALSGDISNDGFTFKESDNMTINDCQLACQKNCSCIAFASPNENNKTGCQIWSEGTNFTDAVFANPVFTYRLIYIRETTAAGDSGKKGSFEKGKKRWSSKTLKAVIATPLAAILFLCMCYLTWRKVYKAKEKWNQERILRELGDNLSLATTQQKRKTQEKGHSMSHDLKIFDFQTIVAATNNFSLINKIGEGGFGPVYKGKLPDGREVAMKRLSRNSGQGMVEFKNEAKLIAKLQHNNLVRLLGCSLLGEEKILVYEYMPNKSLDFFIFGTGYMSPEYAMSGIVSMKIDVFSFGVLVLEIVSGKKNNSCYHSERPLNLIGYDQPTDRPTMSDVVSMLTNETMILPAPKQPAFFVDVNPDEEVLDVLNNDSKHCSVNSATISVLEAR